MKNTEIVSLIASGVRACMHLSAWVHSKCVLQAVQTGLRFELMVWLVLVTKSYNQLFIYTSIAQTPIITYLKEY